MTIFEAVKEHVSVDDVLGIYGMRPIKKYNDKLYYQCPLHDEKTPSFVVYQETNSFYCFGCDVGGDVIKLVEVMQHVSPLEATMELSNIFELDKGAGSAIEYNAGGLWQRIKEERERLKALDEWINHAFVSLCDYWQLLKNAKENSRPLKPGQYDELFVEACQKYDAIEYLMLYLADSDLSADEKYAFYNHYRLELDEINDRISRNAKDNHIS